MSTIKKDKITNASKEIEKREHLNTVGGNINWYSHYENSMEVPQGIKSKTTSNPTYEYISKENKIIISKRLSCNVHSIPKVLKLPKCPSTDE